MIRKFKFKDAIEAKGENARIHYGVGAQSIITKMKEFWLEPMKHTFICYDEWEEELEEVDEWGAVAREYKQAGNRYGIDMKSYYVL